MLSGITAIDICIQRHFLRISTYQRSNGRYCAEIKAADPITKVTHKKTVSSKDKAKFDQKLEAAKKKLYELIRNNFLLCQLSAGPLTLKGYLKLDLPTLKERWPTSYGTKEYAVLGQYADSLTFDLNECARADDFLYLLTDMKLKRDLELVVLRLLADVIDELICLGLYAHKNPIADYYHNAKANDNRKKKENRHPICMALSDHALRAIFGEYDANLLTDARYFAIPLRALGLSPEQIAAVNIGDFVNREGMDTLPIRNQMICPKKRYIRVSLSSEWESRLLPMNWFWSDIEQWIKQYADMGINDMEKIPLCAYGYRKHPKRCTPVEIEDFLQQVLDRHLGKSSELKPSTGKANPSFHDVSRKVTPKALPESFQVAGHTMLSENPFLARYLLGQPADTVDEKVYLDFTSPRIQADMNSSILQVFEKIKGGQRDIV